MSNNCINTTYPIGVLTGGTGTTTLTANSLLLGNTTSPITGLGVATNGQLPIGSTGNPPVLSTLTAGSGISITNGAGSITIASSETQGIVTLDGDSGTATGTTVTLAGGHNITTAGNNASTVTFNVSGTTTNAVQVGNSSGALTSIAVGTTGQVLIGATSANPSFGALGVNSGLTAHGVLLGENNSAIVATAVGTTGQVLIGSTGADPAFNAIGTNSGLTAHSILLAEGNSAFSALGAATNGQLPIGSTGADPVLATITAGSGISVTNGAGSITIAATETQGIVTLDGDSGTATGTTVTLAGGNNITTAGNNASTVTFNVSGTTNHAVQVGNATNSLTSLSVGTTGQVLIGATGANPSFGALGVNSGLTAHGVLLGENNSAIVATAVGTTGQVLIGSTGADPAFGSIGTNSGLTAHSLILAEGNSAFSALGVATNGQLPIGSTGADPVLATLTSGSSANISITNGAGSITVDLVSSPSVSGSVTAGTGFTATTGGLTVTAGNILLPTTSSTSGIIEINGTRFMHSYGSNSTFLGPGAGGFSVTGSGNTGIGKSALDSITNGGNNTVVGNNGATNLTTGSVNVGVGYQTLFKTTGSSNTACGGQTLNNATSGAYNLCLGYDAGTNYTSSESSNILLLNNGTVSESNAIRIGTQGTGNGQQSTCYIAGIEGVTVSTAQIVTINPSTGQLGTMGAQTNGQLNIGSTGASPVAATLTSGSSANISITNGAGSITIDLIAKPVLPSVYGNTTGGTGTAVYIDSSGNLGTVVSSLRYKANITDMGDNSSRVLQLRPVNFKWKKNPEHGIQWGLIAEEVAEIMPEMVNYDDEGQPESVHYHDLSAMLLNELQKLYKRVQILERQLANK